MLYNNSMKRTTATNTADNGNIKNVGSDRRRSSLVLFFYVSKTELKGNEKQWQRQWKTQRTAQQR